MMSRMWASARAETLSPEQSAFLARAEAHIRDIMVRFPGANIEVKPFQRVLHVRGLSQQDPAAAQAAVDAALELDTGDFFRTLGKNVVEFSATASTKGTWLTQLRQQVGATCVVFLGDDVTDEKGFAALMPDDVGVKVGAGDTAADLRLADIEAVADFLTQLAAARGAATVLPGA